MGPDSVECQHFSFRYKASGQEPAPFALSQIDLSLPPGKIYLLAGPTGSGKTTLIRSFNGLIPHFYQGHFFGFVKVKGEDTVDSSPAQLAQIVGSVFQTPENQLFSMSVERELTFALEQLELSRDVIRQRLASVIELVHLQPLLKRSPYELSGGEQQRVAIAAILALEPDILILDEPLSSLDPTTAGEIVQLLARLNQESGKTIILSEHRLKYILDIVDDIVVIAGGSLRAMGDFQAIVQTPLLFELGLDLPALLRWFYRHPTHRGQTGEIPTEFQAQLQALQRYCSESWEHISPSARSGQSAQGPGAGRVAAADPPVLTVSDLSFSYGEVPPARRSAQRGDEAEGYVLRNVSTHIFPGEILGIVGPNGAGKSTFIRCLAGLLPLAPDSGEIYYHGRNISSLKPGELASKVGIMFQNPDHQLFSSTVQAELDFSLKSIDIPADAKVARISEITQQLGIRPLLNQSPFEVSGGQKKKISLASILVRQPEVLIFDEPTIGQDAFQKQTLKDIVHAAHDAGVTVLIVSHDLEFVSALATRVMVIDHGQVYADGPPAAIFSDPALLTRAHLRPSPFIQMYHEILRQFPHLPPDIMTVDQLEEFFNSCH